MHRRPLHPEDQPHVPRLCLSGAPLRHHCNLPLLCCVPFPVSAGLMKAPAIHSLGNRFHSPVRTLPGGFFLSPSRVIYTLKPALGPNSLPLECFFPPRIFIKTLQLYLRLPLYKRPGLLRFRISSASSFVS